MLRYSPGCITRLSLLLAALFSFLGSAVAQNPSILERPPATAPGPPTRTVRSLLEAGKKANKEYRLPDTLRLFEQALVTARAARNKHAEAEILNRIGVVYSNVGQPRKALDYYQQALSLQQQIGDKRGQAATLTNMGRGYTGARQQLKALDYYQQALSLQKQIGDKKK